MRIRKAVITAAGRGLRLYPVADTVQKGMLPVVDRDGLAKPVIQIIAEEALDSGIDEICVVCAPGDQEKYLEQLSLLRKGLIETHKNVAWAADQAKRLDNLVRRLAFAPQDEPLGYGHAVYCAREFIAGEPFLLLLGDHLYISNIPGRRCAQQLINLALTENCAVAAVQSTREHLVGRYGTLSGKRVAASSGIYEIDSIIEKPSVSQAEMSLHTPGLRAGHYLCFFGMHVLTPLIFDILAGQLSNAGANGEIQLTPALQELAKRERYLALELAGSRYDIGRKFGLLQTQIALATAGKDSAEVLSSIIDLLAEANLRIKTEEQDCT